MHQSTLACEARVIVVEAEIFDTEPHPCLPEFVSSGHFFDIMLNLQESYVMLEKAIRSLASFYSKAGPSATLPEQVK